jgi:hypothetical protein
MIVGIVIAGLGLLATIVSWASAERTGHVFLFYGAVLSGGAIFWRGLTRRDRLRQ